MVVWRYMSGPNRMPSIFLVFILSGALTFLGAYVVYGTHIRLSYRAAFDQTRIGETLADVTSRFGPPQIIEGRQSGVGYDYGSRSVCGGACWLRIGYELPFSLNTALLVIDFDIDQRVINKAMLNSP